LSIKSFNTPLSSQYLPNNATSPNHLGITGFSPNPASNLNHSSFFPSTDNFCFSSYCPFSLSSVFSPLFSPFYYFFTFIYLRRCASRGVNDVNYLVIRQQMFKDNRESQLFVDLSHKQQQWVSGGGPTLGIVSDATEYVANTAPTSSGAAAGPLGGTSNGFALPGEIDSFGGQTSLGASGVPGLAIPAALAFPSIAGPRTAALTQPSQQASGIPALPPLPSGLPSLPGLPGAA
jgi:hypothetical protein